SGELKKKLTGHKAAITNVGFSRDNRWIITRSEDNKARFWEVVTGRSAVILPVMPNRRVLPTLSPNGRMVAVQVADGIIQIWPIFESAQQLADYFRAKIARCLTLDQRIDLAFPEDPPAWCLGPQGPKWPFDAAGMIARGEAYSSRHEHDKAIAAYKTAGEMDPRLEPEVTTAVAAEKAGCASQIAQ